MLIDAHVHLFPDRLANAIRDWFSQHAWKIEYLLSVDECVAALKAGGVDRAVALPYAHKPGISRALNDFTLQLSLRDPFVVPCCTVFPGEDGAEALIDEALAGSFRGVKIHSHVMKIAADDARLDPVWRASARYRKPVVIHCGPEPAADGYGADVRALSGADKLRRALDKHSDALAIVPHLGADQFAQFEALLPDYPGLSLDTAMAISGYFDSQMKPPDLEMIRRWPGRILYGTDFPNLPYDWQRELGVLRGLGLDAASLEQVLWRNAARLFGVPG